MRDSKRKSVDPRHGVNGARSDSFRAEPAKSFHFAVTWESLSAQLELRDITEPKLSVFETAAAVSEAVEINAAGLAEVEMAEVEMAEVEIHAIDAEVLEHASTSLAALAAAVSSPPLALTPMRVPVARPEPEGRWEMVVPKMDRPSRTRPAPAHAAANHRQGGNAQSLTSVPAFASSSGGPSPLFSRALALLGQHTKSLLAGSTANGTLSDSERAHQTTPQTSGHSGRAPMFRSYAVGSSSAGENSSSANDAAADRNGGRAVWLSKITNALRGRLHTPGVAAPAAAADEGPGELNHQKEPWLPGAESKEHEESTLV